MQEKIILKLFILSMGSSIALFSASLSPSEIVKMVTEIKKERVGITLSVLDSTEKPFIIRVPKKEKPKEVNEQVVFMPLVEVVYTLKAVLNNAAFIDNKWYKEGDLLGDYKVGHVGSKSVVLNGNKSSKRLSLKKKKKSFIKSNRGNK